MIRWPFKPSYTPLPPSPCSQGHAGRPQGGCREAQAGAVDGAAGGVGAHRLCGAAAGGWIQSAAPPLLLCAVCWCGCGLQGCTCATNQLAITRAPPRPCPALQPHMSFENGDFEAHKDAAQLIQLGINANLSGEHAPKVRERSQGAGAGVVLLTRMPSSIFLQAAAATGLAGCRLPVHARRPAPHRRSAPCSTPSWSSSLACPAPARRRRSGGARSPRASSRRGWRAAGAGGGPRPPPRSPTPLKLGGRQRGWTWTGGRTLEAARCAW